MAARLLAMAACTRPGRALSPTLQLAYTFIGRRIEQTMRDLTRAYQRAPFSLHVCVESVVSYLSCFTRIKPSVESPKSGILVTEVITFDKIAPWVILGRS